MRRAVFIFIQALLVAALLAPFGAADDNRNLKNNTTKFFDPLGPGSLPVGVLTTFFVDKSPTDNFTKEPRTLVTEIWYPATNEARNKPKNKYSDFIPTAITPEIEAQVKSAYKLDMA